jgi:ribosomal protein S18 acetylase RimI-like enzyme
MINYTDNLNNILPSMLNGFFVEFSRKPSAEKLYEILENSEYKILAIDTGKNKVAGFINAISDHTLSSYIPLLEVLPEYRHHGIGSRLVKKMLGKLKNYYMIDLCCDERNSRFYARLGLKKATGMIIRNYNNQTGRIKVK